MSLPISVWICGAVRDKWFAEVTQQILSTGVKIQELVAPHISVQFIISEII